MVLHSITSSGAHAFWTEETLLRWTLKQLLRSIEEKVMTEKKRIGREREAVKGLNLLQHQVELSFELHLPLHQVEPPLRLHLPLHKIDESA